jgi:hypothetical protein
MGLHGAAFVHGVFMAPGTISLEMKTLYAYESLLFFILADGRVGIHGQVDIRKYFAGVDSHRPVDSSLVARMMLALDAAIILQKQQNVDSCGTLASQQRSLSKDMKGDFVVASQCPLPPFSHPLGPMQNESSVVCNQMLLTKVMTEILQQSSNLPLHCDACG